MSNLLSEVHPELIAEWSDKNLSLTPDKITFGSNRSVWWKGACGHEWQTSVKARSNGEKCPICSGSRVAEGINDLATLKPELAAEWSKKNTLKPTEVSIGSHKKIVWKGDCGHEWMAETVGIERKTLNVAGAEYPYQFVKGKLLKVDYSHIQYVLECLHKNTTKIHNIRAYLLTCLFNAPSTINSYYRAEVNYDMYGIP